MRTPPNNRTIASLENWSIQPSAKTIIFVFKDTIVLNFICIASTCSPITSLNTFITTQHLSEQAVYYQAHDFGREPREPKPSNGSESANGWLGDNWKTVGATGLLVSLLVGVGGYFGYRNRLLRRQAAAVVEAGISVGIAEPLLDFPGVQASAVSEDSQRGEVIHHASMSSIKFAEHECKTRFEKGNVLQGACWKRAEDVRVSLKAENKELKWNLNQAGVHEVRLPENFQASLTQWEAVEAYYVEQEKRKQVVLRNAVLQSVGSYFYIRPWVIRFSS